MKIIIIVIVHIFLLIFIYNDYNMSKEAADWPSTEGKLINAEVDRRYYSGKEVFYPQIKYSYKVNKQKYTSNNIGLIESRFPMRSFADQELRKYTKTKNLIVYYDPDDPSKAYLDTKFTLGMYLNSYFSP